MKDCIEIIAAVFTVFGFIVVVYQLLLQKKKDRVELILKLSTEFFNNSKFMAVFKILDSDNLRDCNESIKRIINGWEVKSVDGQMIESVEEIDINAYMNFLNSLAILVEEGIVSQVDVMKLFRYQLEKTFASKEMISYMQNYGFERIKILLPQSFFFYGTLKSESDRSLLEDVNEISSYLCNDNELELLGYKIVSVGPNDEYKGLVKSKGLELLPVEGVEVRILQGADWTMLFDKLDLYEEVDLLYNRAIIEVNNTNRFVWVYLKKQQ